MAKKRKGARGVRARSRRWADLPKELLALIAERLYALVDFQRFRATCKSWRSSTMILPKRTSMNGAIEVPPLIVSREDQTIQQRFYTTEEFPCPADTYNTCIVYLAKQKNENPAGCSSDKLWLALVGERCKNKMQVESVSTSALGYGRKDIPKELNILDLCMSELGKHYFLVRSPITRQFLRHFDDKNQPFNKIAFILLSSSAAGEYAAVGLYCLEGKLAFLKSSKEGIWTSIDNYQAGYIDIIDYYYRFYAVHYTGKLLRIDLSGKVTEVASSINNETGGIQKILIESGGELLLLDKYLKYADINKVTQRKPKTWFKVYKLNEEEETHKFVETRSLGHIMLFLTRKYCNFSVSAQQLPGCIPNRIYLAEHCENAYHLDGRTRWELTTHCIGVFNLDKNTYKRIKRWYNS